MLQLKTKSTSRKFYNKWLYKISLQIDGCVIFRTQPTSNIKDWLESFNSTVEYGYQYDTWRKAAANKEIISSICDFLNGYEEDTYATRVERNRLDVYTNDPEFYEKLSLCSQDYMVHRFEPNINNVDILNNSQNSITVDKLPKGRYRYRVYLMPHKMAKDREGKQKYLAWLKSQSPRITCTPAIERWFLTTDWNWDRRYVLVEDESTLLMMKLRGAEVVGRVYNFVVYDK
jgi:hypothetical protein